MAGSLTEAQVNKVAKILMITSIDINQQIAYLGENFTTQDAIDISAAITTWDAGAGTKYTRVHPRERNFGAEINPTDQKNDLRSDIAILLSRPDWANASGGSVMELGRG